MQNDEAGVGHARLAHGSVGYVIDGLVYGGVGIEVGTELYAVAFTPVTLAREAQQRGDDMMALVRTACGNDAYYNAMVEEYKRNFSMLLAGRYLSNADHLEGYVRKAEAETEASVDSDRAIELTVRVVMFAYVRGLRQTGEDARSDRSVHLGQVHPLRGATLFRLMLDAMNILLLDEAVDFADAEAADLASLFLKVCQTQHNFTVMTDEMDRTYSELMKE